MHLVSVITGLDREERRDEGRPNTAGCGDRLWKVLRVLWEGKQASQEVISSPPHPRPNLASPPFLLTLGFFFDLCVFLISDLFVHLPTPVPDGL